MKKNFIYISIFSLLSYCLVSCSEQLPNSTEELFHNNFELVEASNLYSSRTGPRESSTEETEKNKILVSSSAKGVVAYNKQRYPGAIQHFSAYVNSLGKKNTEIGLYLSISYLANNQLLEAQQGFEHLLKKGNKSIKKDAEWYLVLTLIRNNKLPNALRYLSKITAKKTNSYRPKAVQLKKQLEAYMAQK